LPQYSNLPSGIHLFVYLFCSFFLYLSFICLFIDLFLHLLFIYLFNFSADIAVYPSQPHAYAPQQQYEQQNQQQQTNMNGIQNNTANFVQLEAQGSSTPVSSSNNEFTF
jgi:hypothetical protein